MATQNNQAHQGGEAQDHTEAHEKGASRREGERPPVFLLWRPMHYAERKCFEPLSAWLKSWALFDILDRVGKGVIALSLVLYITECGSRRDATTNQAWAVFAAASGKPGDLGRRKALERLISEEQDLRYLDLSGAHLEEMQLSGVNLTGVRLVDADLFEAKLIKATLYRAKLNGAGFREANLSGANLLFADLSGADLFRADLSGADLFQADLSGANLGLADLSGAYLWGANLSGATLLAVNLDGARVRSASWVEDVLHPADGEPVKGLNPGDWHVVHEEGDDPGWYRIRPVVEPSEP